MHGGFLDGAGLPVSGAVVFTPCTPHLDPDTGIVTVCPLVYPLTNGEFTTGQLDAGCWVVRVVLECRNCPQESVYTIELPDDTDTHELSVLIESSLPLPPSVPQHVISVGGLSGVITQAQIAAMVGIGSFNGFVYQQVAPSSNWNITHTLGRIPLSVQVVVGGIPVIADVVTITATQVVIEFPSPQSGTVYLS